MTKTPAPLQVIFLALMNVLIAGILNAMLRIMVSITAGNASHAKRNTTTKTPTTASTGMTTNTSPSLSHHVVTEI
jgi:hypothetical protein